jgi:transposase, IS30 family
MHSWEKGTVENRIGLIRRRYPKGTDFARLTVREIKRLESSLNRRPCKCLGFKTPAEVFRLERCT